MALKLYADAPLRRGRQVLADVLVLLWIVLWWRVGVAVHGVTLALAAPGRTLEGAGRSLGDNLRQAGERAGGVPLLGDRLGGPFTDAAGAADAIRRAGVQQQETVSTLALVLALVVALVPVLLVLVPWLVVRYRFARQAGAAQRFIDSDADLRLFALRAMALQPMHVLARVSDDPVGAWERRDGEVVRSLALLELQDAGLRPPT
jgi:hypothetical protein